MPQFVVDRDGEPSLEFEGVTLGQVDSQRPGKPAWTELALYRTNGGTYVLQTVARVTPGYQTREANGTWRTWTDWFSAVTLDTAAALVDELVRRGKKGGLPARLLALAFDVDDDVANYVEELETRIERIN